MKDKIIKILESYIVENIGETSPKIDIENIKAITDEILSLQLLQPDVITSVCDNCQDVTGFNLGMTCPKCKRPFREVKQTVL